MSDAAVDRAMAALSPGEREVLAVLAVAGESALSEQHVRELAGTPDAEAAIAELERRGLLRREEDEKVAAAPGVRERLAKVWDVVDTGDRVLQQLISIAEDGRLTVDDLDAVLGISEWACELGRFEDLLQLVQTVQKTVSVVNKIGAWIPIVERAREAAVALGDAEAEAWAEAELRRARLLARNARAAPRRFARSAARTPPPSRLPPWVAVAAALATAGVGFGIGWLTGGSDADGEPGATTVTAPKRTVTLGGRTVTLSGTTVTIPPTTVTVPGTTVSVPAVTETVTTTVTVTEPQSPVR